MSTYASTAAAAADKYLQTLAQGQEQFIDYLRTAREYMPRPIEPPAGLAPFPGPTLQQLAEVQFSFTAKLLDQQQKFLRRLFSATSPGKPAASRASAAKSPKSATSPKTSSRSTRKQ